MKWTYIVTQKFKAAVILGIVFILMLTTNMLDRTHFNKLQKAFDAVYTDRLLVETYIYKLSKLLDSKKAIADKNSAHIHQINHAIDGLIVDYEATRLTPDETFHFTNLKKNIASLALLESRYEQNSVDNQAKDLETAINIQHDRLSSDLENLSAIQLSEGKKILESSNKIIATSSFTSSLEICLLIVLGIILQAFVFASKSLGSTVFQKSSLN